MLNRTLGRCIQQCHDRACAVGSGCIVLVCLDLWMVYNSLLDLPMTLMRLLAYVWPCKVLGGNRPHMHVSCSTPSTLLMQMSPKPNSG